MKTFRFVVLNKYLKKENVKVLDVGAGSHSATQTKKYFSNCIYHGVDQTKDYCNDSEDFKLMDEFFELDLCELKFDAIEDEFYDVIIMSHVIEHLWNGGDVIKALLPKLKKDGVIYIEYPSFHSTKLPSMKETLNFFDDKTHCRIYSLMEIYNLLMSENIEIVNGGKRRQWRNILLVPFKSVVQILAKGYIRGGVMWDLCGFAEYVIAKRKSI